MVIINGRKFWQLKYLCKTTISTSVKWICTEHTTSLSLEANTKSRSNV